MESRLPLGFVSAVVVHVVVLFGLSSLGRPAPTQPSLPELVVVHLVETPPKVEPPRPDPVADAAPAPTATPKPAAAPRKKRAVALAPARPASDVVVPAAAAPEPTPEVVPPPPTPPAPEPTPAPSRGEVIKARPRYRSNPRPDYPLESQRHREEGVVMLSVEVTADGRAAAVALAKTSGFPALDEAALETVRGWTFEPGRVDGQPVASQVVVPVRFSLDAR